MRNLRNIVICLLAAIFGLMSLYELSAKSPTLLGSPLPGWRKSCRVERQTPWRQPTGIILVDMLLHEGQETLLFYGFLAG